MVTLTIGSNANNVPLGSPVEVAVAISGLATTLASYRFDVAFSPGILSALTTNPGTVDNAAGTITGIANSNVNLNFGATLLKLNFHAIGAGTCDLSIAAASVTLLDSNGSEIPFATTNGKVFVAAPLPT